MKRYLFLNRHFGSRSEFAVLYYCVSFYCPQTVPAQILKIFFSPSQVLTADVGKCLTHISMWNVNSVSRGKKKKMLGFQSHSGNNICLKYNEIILRACTLLRTRIFYKLFAGIRAGSEGFLFDFKMTISCFPKSFLFQADKCFSLLLCKYEIIRIPTVFSPRKMKAVAYLWGFECPI